VRDEEVGFRKFLKAWEGLQSILFTGHDLQQAITRSKNRALKKTA
jgi:hypothetical protein